MLGDKQYTQVLSGIKTRHTTKKSNCGDYTKGSRNMQMTPLTFSHEHIKAYFKQYGVKPYNRMATH